MDQAQIEIVRGEVDGLERDLAEERFRHVSGVEPAPSIVPIFAARSRAAHRATAAALRVAGEAALADRVAALRAERVAGAAEEAWRADETRASGRGPDGIVPMAAAERALLRERDRGRRLAFGRAAAEAASLAAPAREAALEQRARARAEVGLSPDWPRVVEADELLAASGDAYRDVLAWSARRELSLALPPGGDLERADLLQLLALGRLDGLFKPRMLAPALSGAAAGLGLDLGRIRIDEADRPAQRPGAHAVGTAVSLRRRGGVSDWLDLFGAAGRALSRAWAPPHSLDPAFPAALGELLSGLLLDPLFLARSVGTEKRELADLVRMLALSRLFALRARAAALRVASEVERGTSGTVWREAHREALSAAALASWPDGLAARDGDATESGAFLAGAAWAERLRRTLRERFDDDWWRNPRTASHLAGLLAAGSPGPETERPPLALAAEALVAKLSGGA